MSCFAGGVNGNAPLNGVLYAFSCLLIVIVNFTIVILLLR
jgi:hypothetical protein